MLQLHFAHQAPTTDRQPRQGNRRPCYPRESAPYLFTRPSHCEICRISLGTSVSRFQISSIQDVAHCTMALIDCMASIYMHLGLAKDDER